MSVTRSKAKKGTVTRSKAFAFHGSRVCHLSKYGIMFQHTLDLHVIRELALCQEFTNVSTFTINDLPQYFLDIDECRDGKSRCSSNGRCINTQGSFSCQCVDGFYGKGKYCYYEDECGSGPCDTNAFCNNSEGSYLCTCKSDFYGNGFSCSGQDRPTLGP